MAYSVCGTPEYLAPEILTKSINLLILLQERWL